MNKKTHAVLATAVALGAGSAVAHHSFAMFDQSQTITLEGKITDFR